MPEHPAVKKYDLIEKALAGELEELPQEEGSSLARLYDHINRLGYSIGFFR